MSPLASAVTALPVLKGRALDDFSDQHGGPARIVAGFNQGDVFALTHLHPNRFYDHGRPIWAHVLIQMASGEWVSLDDTQVGYGGTGPKRTNQALQGLGVPDEVAADVARERISDVYLDGTVTTLLGGSESLLLRGLPVPVNNTCVVPLDFEGEPPSLHPYRPLKDEHNDQPSMFATWIQFLDQPTPPDWAEGNRSARVYTDPDAAMDAGLTERTLGDNSAGAIGHFQMVIQQGDIQLWVALLPPDDESQIAHPTTYDRLETAGFDVTALKTADARPAWRRRLTHRNKPTPDYVDLGDQPITTPHRGTRQ